MRYSREMKMFPGLMSRWTSCLLWMYCRPCTKKTLKLTLHYSFADPNPYVFGPPGSVSQRYGSGSYYHKAKIVRKTLRFLLFCGFFITVYL
jgi:hypothetical protein